MRRKDRRATPRGKKYANRGTGLTTGYPKGKKYMSKSGKNKTVKRKRIGA